MANYRKPPIIEAVIELRTADSVPDRLVDKAASTIRKRYPKSEVLHEFTVKLGLPSAAKTEKIGHKLTADTGEFVSQVARRRMAFSSLAPYPGWTAFTEEFRDIYSRWSKVVGQRRLDRVGIRFINRIDIPLEPSGFLRSEDFLHVGITLPPSTGNFSDAWQVTGVCPVQGTPFMVTIRCGTTDAALFGYASFSLDLDLHTEVDVPQSDTDLWNLLAAAKVAKNQVFEECITDRTRALLA